MLLHTIYQTFLIWSLGIGTYLKIIKIKITLNPLSRGEIVKGGKHA